MKQSACRLRSIAQSLTFLPCMKTDVRVHREMTHDLGDAVLTIRSIRTTPVLVPMTFALGTSAARVTEAPLLLVDLETEEGVTGRTYLFCYRLAGARAIALLLEDAVSLVKGEQVRPADIAAKLARSFALMGVTGTVRMALSGLDVAMWDALAIAARQPLVSMLGSAPRPIRAYNSCGLGLMTPPALAGSSPRSAACAPGAAVRAATPRCIRGHARPPGSSGPARRRG